MRARTAALPVGAQALTSKPLAMHHKYNVSRMKLLLTTIEDYIENGYVRTDELTFSAPSGKKNPGGKGLLHLILFRHEIKGYLLGPWAIAHGIPEKTRNKAAEVFEDAKSFRTYFGHGTDPVDIDLTWQAAFHASGGCLA